MTSSGAGAARTGGPRVRNFAQLVAANRRRSKAGARRQVVEARRAVRAIERFANHPIALQYNNCHAVYHRALMLRIAHPTASLAEIAAVQRISKDAYSGRLRRAFRYAATFDAKRTSRKGAA